MNAVPRPDEGWKPAQQPRVMRDSNGPLCERIAQGIIWSAEAAIKARRSGAAIYPQAPHRDPAWCILLHLLVEEARNRIVTIGSLAVLEDLLPGKNALWIEIFERLELVRLVEAGYGVDHVELTPAARHVILELLLEPTTWNGPVLCQNITVSHLWQLSRSHNCLM